MSLETAIPLEETWDETRLKRDRLRGVQAQMKEKGVGAMYLRDSCYVRYLINLKVPGGAVFVPAEGEVIAFIRPRDMGYVKLRHPNSRPPIYRRFEIRDGSDPNESNRFGRLTAELMAEHGVAGEPLGVDDLGPSALVALQSANLDLVEASPIIERNWSIKTEDEVAIYHLIGDQYAYTISRFRDSLRPGITENELAGIVTSAWYEAGGEDIAQLNICGGENMSPWRRWPTQRPLQNGEFVGIDLHGRGIAGLRGDGSRTFFVGDRPTPEQSDLYRRSYAFLLESMDNFRAGRSFQEVATSVSALVPEEFRPQQFNLNLGHGASLGYSAYPHIDPRREQQVNDELHVNQLIAVECLFGELGSGVAVKLEEMIIVQDGPPEQIASIPFDDRFAPA